MMSINPPNRKRRIWNPARTEFDRINKKSLDNFMTRFTERTNFVKRFTWSIPSEDIPSEILKYTNKLVEIGAGGGYWKRYLKQYGITVDAYDILPYKNEWVDCRHDKVSIGDPSVLLDTFPNSRINRWVDHGLLLCWPNYEAPTAHISLTNFKGDYLVYVGEGSGGCTGDDNFHKALDNWELLWHNYPPNWDGIHSQEYIFKRIK